MQDLIMTVQRLIEVRISPIEPVTPMVPSGKANHEMEGLS